MNNLFRHTYLKINLDNLIHNINEIKNYISKDVTIGTVLKADAYGHGAKEIARTLYENDITYFLVSTLLEGLELKKSNENYNVFIMGHTPNEYLEEIVKNDLISTIFTVDQAKILNVFAIKHKKIIKVHIKIDTGFNRLGMKVNNNTIKNIKEINQLPNIEMEGIFSHLALKNKEFDTIQFNKLKKLINSLKSEGISFKYNHICDSISTVLHPDFQMDMVRVGAIIYGLQSEEKGILDIKQVMSFHSKFSYIRKIKKGESISYGMRWIAKRDSIIGTLPFGYADGYPRNMYQKGYITINEKQAPIVGVICMDQCMVDLTDIENLNENDEVTIFSDGSNNSISIDTLANLAGTNKNDIVSRFTKRVPRIYIKNNKVYNIKNELI